MERVQAEPSHSVRHTSLRERQGVRMSIQPAASHGLLRLALGPQEAAQALGVSRDFLDEHIAAELRWVRRGRRKLVSVKELERWLEQSAARTLER